MQKKINDTYIFFCSLLKKDLTMNGDQKMNGVGFFLGDLYLTVLLFLCLLMLAITQTTAKSREQ